MYLFSIGVNCFYGLVSLDLAIHLSMISLIIFYIMCHRKKVVQLLHITRSTCAKYQLYFVELCVHIYLLCASLSILAKYRAQDFASDINAVLLQPRTLSTLHKLDVAATMSILAAHLVGYHDVSDRIFKWLVFHGRVPHKRIHWLW